MKKAKTEPIKRFHSTYPLSAYLLFIGSCGFVINGVLNHYPFLSIFFSGIICFGLYYITFCRWACSVTIEGNRMELNYFFTKEIIHFHQLRIMDYHRSYYDWSAEKNHSYKDFPIYSYDDMIVTYTDEKKQVVQRTLNINTMMGGFSGMRRFLAKNAN